MGSIEYLIDECLKLFGGKVVGARYKDEGKKRLMNYLKWNKEKRNPQEKIVKDVNKKW